MTGPSTKTTAGEVPSIDATVFALIRCCMHLIDVSQSKGLKRPPSSRTAASSESSEEPSSEKSASEASTEVAARDVDFDYEDGDVILRSNDGLDFRVHKLILKLASEKLGDLIDNPPSSGSDKRRKVGNPQDPSLTIIPLDEAWNVIDTLLRYIYPVADEIKEDLAGLVSDIQLTDKWGLVEVRDGLCERLDDEYFIVEDAVLVYDIAKRFEMREVQKSALRHMYSLSLEANDQYFMNDELQLTAKDMQRILLWKKKYVESVMSIIEWYTMPRAGGVKPRCKGCAGAAKWCWWDDFLHRLRNVHKYCWDQLEILIVSAMDAQKCQAPPSEVHRILKKFKEDIEEKTADLPVEFDVSHFLPFIASISDLRVAVMKHDVLSSPFIPLYLSLQVVDPSCSDHYNPCV